MADSYKPPFTVNVIGDMTAESHECVVLNLSPASGTVNSGVPATSQLVIKNDD